MNNLLPFPATIPELVAWLGQPVAAGVIISLLLERTKWFQRLKRQAKKRVTIMIFVLLPFVSMAAQWGLEHADPQLVQTVTIALALAMQGVMGWGSSQWAHQQDKAAKASPPSVSPPPTP